MKKKDATNPIDSDLSDLYTRAKREKAECPHCKKMIELGGDFGQLVKAMELRLKYEAIKAKINPENSTPDFFKEDEDGKDNP